MSRKTKQDSLETRNRLLDAAEQVFYDKGFAHTTLMDIASAAEMTRGAIYWHFKNKTEIFEAMVDRVHLPLESLAEYCPDIDEPDPLVRLREFTILVLKETVRNPRRRRVFTILFHKLEINGEAKALELRQQAAFMDSTQRIEGTLASAVEKKLLPEDLDIHKAAVVMHAFFTGVMSNWLFLPQRFDLETEAESMVDGILDMLKFSPAMRHA